MTVVCPRCGKDDAIQKVSSIVAAGEASGTFSGPTGGVVRMDGKWGAMGGMTTLSGTTKTVLAQKFAPPPKPEKEGMGCALNLLRLGVGYLVFNLGVIPGALVIQLANEVNGTTQGLLRAVGVILAVAGGIAAVVWVDRQLTRGKKKEAEEKWQHQMQLWEHAMAKWKRAYYCFRDDIVFDPETGESADPDHFPAFLLSGVSLESEDWR